MNGICPLLKRDIKRSNILLFYLLLFLPLKAQYNTDHLVTIGRSALYFEDFVLSIRYFNQAISAKPYLYEPWFYRGVAKYYLDDFSGAEYDCSEAIRRNPYVVSSYELRGLARIQQEKYSDAIDDYTTALRYDPENRKITPAPVGGKRCRRPVPQHVRRYFRRRQRRKRVFREQFYKR